ncbi:MAG: conjugal transfer protein MobC [Bacteroidota bacterium]
MQTGENHEALRRIFDLLRLGSVLLLLVHLYANCFDLFRSWHLTADVVNNFVYNLTTHISFFRELLQQKMAALILLTVSLLGVKGKKDAELSFRPVLFLIGVGLVLYFLSGVFVRFSYLYAILTCIGFLLILSGGSRLSRIIHIKWDKDIFNDLNETFPQEERKLENEFSINLPAQYSLKGKLRSSWINVINPFRALLVMGTPGSGKSYFVIRHVITQHIKKGFSFFIYDFKFPDLSLIAFNHLLSNLGLYAVVPKMYFINFDDLARTHRCNVLYPDSLLDITDATESSRTIMLALNREWIKKSGDFFVESPINFTTAIFWYLKKYKKGKYCTLPHAIELAQVPYDKLFQVLSTEPEIEVLINPFVSAFINKAMEQLEGQIASAKIGLARLASPSLYYVLSGNDFTLDVNNPEHPKLICVGNNPSKQQIYGAVLSLYIERMLKLVNRKGQLKSSLVFDEFPTVYVNNIDNLIATARSNKVATTLGIQDFSQLRKDYGKEQADVIMNVAGNIISGQVIGETAKQLSDRIGKIMQDRESVSINATDTSVSKSKQLEAAIPPAKIANLSSGEFVGAVADDPTTKIKLKAFHAEFLNDHAALAAEEKNYQPIPEIRKIEHAEVMENYFAIKKDIKRLVEEELENIKNHPEAKAIAEKFAAAAQQKKGGGRAKMKSL